MIIAFDTRKYVKTQKEEIMNAVMRYGNKLYFELGGKLFDDYHATRVLPGFQSDTKIKMLSGLKSEAELIICVNSENIQNGRIRSDYNTLYTDDCIKLIQIYRDLGFLVSGIVLTAYREQPKAVEFTKKLRKMGEKVYHFWYIEDYPNDFDKILESFEKNDFIKTTKPLVVMTSSGSASGKLSACLSQLYNEYKRGRRVGYAKYDIFPVWDLPINHPLNLAFEAATADSNDRVLIDNFYYEKYHKIVSNYNRDLDVFPAIKKIIDVVNDKEIFSSPTEMVINTMSEAIINEDIVYQEAKAEVCRRYFTYYKQFLRGHINELPILRVKEIMDKNGIKLDDYKMIPISRNWFENNHEGIVLELKDSEMFFIQNVNGISIIANLLISVLNKKFDLNIDVNKIKKLNITVKDIIQYLIKETKLNESKISEMLQILKGSYAHSSFILSLEEESELKELEVFLTCEPYLKS